VSGLFTSSRRLVGTEGALARYRVMALIVGTGLAILCFIGIPLQLAGDNKWPWTAVVQIVGPIHGIFYIVYLLTCLDLAARARFRTSQLLGMVCSGLVPLLAFYMERKVTQRVMAQLALGADAPPAPAAVVWAALVHPRREERHEHKPEPDAGDGAGTGEPPAHVQSQPGGAPGEASAKQL
jgi:integral membrane protein